MIPIHQCGTVPPHERIARVTRKLFAACLFLAAPIALAIQPEAPDQGIPQPRLQHAISAADIEVQPELEAATSLTASTRVEASAFQQRYGGSGIPHIRAATSSCADSKREQFRRSQPKDQTTNV